MEGKESRGAWGNILAFPRPGRRYKPRRDGLTMVIDKGLGLTETRDLLELAADYIDSIKLTFGTSAFYPASILQEKTQLCRRYGVDIFPGGTFLEIALIQGALGRFLTRAQELGFNAIEVSDGTITMTPQTRLWVIEQALAAGFKVITEVGKKHPADQLPVEQMVAQVRADLDAGAAHVIVEGRESGVGVGIYGADGHVKQSDLEAILAAVPHPEQLIWEAPLKLQQQSLILRLGTNVNLGNIPPGDVLALEALRVGLRGDTLREQLRQAPAVEGMAEGAGEFDKLRHR